MRVHFDHAFWTMTRPYAFCGWEERLIWIGLCLGNHHSDDALSITLYHDLSDRQLRALLALANRRAN